MDVNTYTLIISNGVELPPIDNEISIQYRDKQATTITSWLTGETKPNYIRKDVVEIPVSWSSISIDQMNLILENTKSQDEGYTLVEFYDVNSNSRITKKMIRSDRSIVMKVLKGGLAVNLSFNLCEV